MTPPQMPVHRQSLPSSIVAQKVQLIHKLFLLEKARNTLEQELLDFTTKAYEEVQGFFTSSFPTSVFRDLTKALDSKCQAVDKLLALLKDLAVDPHMCLKNRVRTNQLQPLPNKAYLMTNVLKFGPMLQNSLMSPSVAKAVQVLGATQHLQKVKHFLISQPAAVQQDDVIRSITSSYNNVPATTSSSSDLKPEEKEHVIVFEEKRPSDAVILLPASIQSPKIIFPEISNPKPMKIRPLSSSGQEEDVQLRHQKQTSAQLLHFLRAKAKNVGALEVTVTEWSKSMYTSCSPQSMSRTVKTQSYQFRQVVTDGVINTKVPKTLTADTESQAPVFRVKRVESSGSLTYTCVIATKTELWDIGDIFTEVGHGNLLQNTDCRNLTAQVENASASNHSKTTTLQCTEPEHEGNSAGAKTPVINSIAIPEFQIQRFKETEVVVSHIVSPDNFYVQHADSIVKLQALVTDSMKASSSYAEQNCIPDIGTKVMGWFSKQEQWCRAQVTKICGISGEKNATDGARNNLSIKVEVKRLDHGDSACLPLWNIKELTPEMAALPLQAVQVSLASVTPVNGSEWSEEAVGWFHAMVNNRTLYARLYPQGPKVTAELFLEKGKLSAMRRGASLSLRLAQNGHAKHCKLRDMGHMKRGTVQVNMRKQLSEWEKYLNSWYAQSSSESRPCV